MTCHALKRKREKENSYSEVKRDEEVKKPIRSGSPNDIRNKEDISKNDQKSPLYLLKLLSHLSILTMKITSQVLFAEGGYS